jgi:hypothetical protein
MDVRHFTPVLILLFLFSRHTYAQDAAIFPPSAEKRSIRAFKMDDFLKVDGRLDEGAWVYAGEAGDFVQVEPRQGERASQATTFRILYNRQFLYLGVFSRDSLGKKAIRATDFRRDFNTRQHDHISLALDGFRDGRNAMVFSSNAYGVQRDLLAFDDVFYDVDWDGLWRVRTTRTDSGWAAEIAIPWITLRYPKPIDTLQTWGFNLTRNRRSTNELTAFSPFPRVFTATRMEYAGAIENLQPPPPRANVRFQPYGLYAFDRYRRSATETTDQSRFKAGGELKWAINTNSVLDLTFNTDFAQADVDRQVNNVTRFSVFFPERRQFFLENASLFGFYVGQAPDLSGGSMRIQPFFSRSIGLDNTGRPIPIEAGGRFVHRSARQNLGAMAIRQRAPGQDPTDFYIARYSANFGAQNRIGGLMSVKTNPGSTTLLSTVDGFFRLSEKHSLNTLAVHSTGNNNQKQGFAGMAQYYFATNNWKVWHTQSVVTKNFNPEMGFVSRIDVIGATPGVNWYYRGKYLPLRKIIRAFEPSLLPEFYWQASSGKLIERQLWVAPIWFNLQKGGHLGYGINPYFQRLPEPFRPLGIRIATGDYRYLRHQFYLGSDPSKIISMNLNTEWGTYFNGRLWSSDIRVTLAPSPHLSFLSRFNRNAFRNVGEAKVDKTINLYSIEGRFALNPRVQFIAFYQQNSENSSKNYNLRLSWEYQPLSFLYIVVNNSSFQNNLDFRQAEDHAIVKLSFLKQL